MNIYAYNNLALYLSDFYESKKKMNANFSLQVWCKQIGMTSTSALSHILNGQRSIPAKFVPSFINYINLSDNEARYFMELFFHEKAVEDFDENSILFKINPFNWKKKKIVKDYEILSSPLYFTIRTIMQRNGLKSASFFELRKVLVSDITDDTIKNVINLIKHQSKVNSDRMVTNTDILDPKVQDIHRYYLSLAMKRVQTVDIKEREFNNFSININKDDLPEIKEKIRFFIDSLIETYDQDKVEHSTFQLGSYLYPLTKDREC